MPWKVISERLGHASVAFTLDTDSHAIPGMDEQAARLAAEAILGVSAAPDKAAVTNPVTVPVQTPLE